MFAPTTKFLVIDDILSMRKIIRNALRDIGFKNVSEAEDCKTALTLIHQAHSSDDPYQIIISDWIMEGMQGVDLLKTLRADARFKALPFLLITGETEIKKVSEGIQAGASAYIIKPFTANLLKKRLLSVYQGIHSKS